MVQVTINVTIYKFRDVWYMQYRKNGTRIRKSLGTKNKSVARKLAIAEEEKIRQRENISLNGKTKLDDFFEKYLVYAQTIKRPNTIRDDKQFWKQFVEWLKNKDINRVDQVTAQIFESYRMHLSKNGLKNSSINVHHRHMSSIMTYAQKNGYIDFNPLKGIKQYKQSQNPPKFLSTEQIDKLIAEAKRESEKSGPKVLFIFSLGIYAGFRNSEIANAKWEWFDFESDLITIKEDAFRKFVPKSHQCRTIPMNNKLKAILETHKNEKGYLLESDYPEEDRVNWIRFDFKRSFTTVKIRAGLEWITPHVLRHTFASQLAIAGVSLFKIQKWLGHSSPKTTMIYAHLQAQDDDINKI
jgi:site-specific recombinase XerD